jgi:hypothetical protein
VRAWAREEAERHPELEALGYFGSYARGDWGVGSDLDVVAVVTDAPDPPERRTRGWGHTRLPVPCDLVILTRAEWTELMTSDRRFARVLGQEAVWVWPPRAEGPAPTGRVR